MSSEDEQLIDTAIAQAWQAHNWGNILVSVSQAEREAMRADFLVIDDEFVDPRGGTFRDRLVARVVVVNDNGQPKRTAFGAYMAVADYLKQKRDREHVAAFNASMARYH